jgi:hypothetical protein
MTQTHNTERSSPATTSAARQSGCEAPAWQARKSSAERSDAGLVGFKKQSDPNIIRINHADAHKKRLNRMRLVVKGAAWGIQDALTSTGFRFRAALGTVTYDPKKSEYSPNHIRDLMRHYRRWFKRRKEPFRCVWVAELHKDCRVHYHFVFWARKGLTPPKPDKQGWWPHGSSNVKWARKPVGYIVKYASKGDAKDQFPKGARIYGISGPTGHLGWFRAPQWFRGRSKPYNKVMKKHGFWCDFDVGIGLRSPWVYDSSDETGMTLRYVGWSEFDFVFCCWGDEAWK